MFTGVKHGVKLSFKSDDVQPIVKNNRTLLVVIKLNWPVLSFSPGALTIRKPVLNNTELQEITLLSPCVISLELSLVLRLEKKKVLIGLSSHKANKFVKKATLICSGRKLAPVGLHIPFSTLQATVHLECVGANCKIFCCLMAFLKVVKYRLFFV